MSKELTFRQVAPEILDGLCSDDPRAMASRRDLKRVNALMFHATIMAGLLRRYVAKPPSRILDIGAGDGTFMLAVARRLARDWPNVELILLDRAGRVTRESHEDFSRLGWRTRSVSADVFEWVSLSGEAGFDAVTSNLFLHHFGDADLAKLFAVLRPRTAVFVAAEPRRSTVAAAASRLLWAIGANDITRHDAPASVRAGFNGNELSTLWPAGPGDLVEERRVGPFTHIFAATRKKP